MLDENTTSNIFNENKNWRGHRLFTDANFLFLNELVSAVNSTQYTRLIITTTAEQKLLQDTSDKVKKITAFDAFDVANNLKESVSRGADPLVHSKRKRCIIVIRKRHCKIH